MKFDYRVNVDTDLETLWSLVVDIPRAATCVPGLVKLEEVSPSQYLGTVKVRVGPVALEISGEVTVEEMDAAAKMCVYASAAKDRKVPGRVTAHTTLSLEENSAGGIDLVVVSEAKIMGKLGEFGQSIIKRKADAIVKECTQNLVQLITNL